MGDLDGFALDLEALATRHRMPRKRPAPARLAEGRALKKAMVPVALRVERTATFHDSLLGLVTATMRSPSQRMHVTTMELPRDL